MYRRVLQIGVLGLLPLFGTELTAGWVSSPMSWSPDSRWLSYTTCNWSEKAHLRPGWLFETQRDQIRAAVSNPGDHLLERSGPVSFRIWAAHRNTHSSVLIEESRWPLSSPSWSPEGKSIAFLRLVPNSIASTDSVERAAFEVVIQRELSRKRVIWSSPDLELDTATRTSLPHLTCAWSQDGRFLAVPRPGVHPAVVILRTDTKRLVSTQEGALLPAWSPDGSRVAFLRAERQNYSLQLVERTGDVFTAPRTLASTVPFACRPFWTSDGHSIFVVVERAFGRFRQVGLERVFLDGGESVPALGLLPDPLRRQGVVRGLTIDCDRDWERCIFAVDQQGQESALVWAMPRDREVYKRFQPIDTSLSVRSLALSPDGATVALRVESGGGLSPPAFCDLSSEHVTLVAADESARQCWLGVLIGVARGLLCEDLPPASEGGQRALRPTLLPLPGELSALRTPPPAPVPQPGRVENPFLRDFQSHEPLEPRLRRLARLGSSLCEDLPGEQGSNDADCALEARLFFAYLLEDFSIAESCLETLEQRMTSPDLRLAALAVKAQVLWASGEHARARPLIDHVLSLTGTDTVQIEDTPLGPRLTREVTPRQAWARYLSVRLTAEAASNPPGTESSLAVPDLRLWNLFRAPEGVLIEGGGGGFPFAPGQRMP